MPNRERIIINDEGDDLLRETVTREVVPSTELVFAGTGPARGEYEARELAVEYLPPRRRAA